MFDAYVKILEKFGKAIFLIFWDVKNLCKQIYLNLEGRKQGNSFLSVKVTKQNRLDPKLIQNNFLILLTTVKHVEIVYLI